LLIFTQNARIFLNLLSSFLTFSHFFTIFRYFSLAYLTQSLQPEPPTPIFTRLQRVSPLKSPKISPQKTPNFQKFPQKILKTESPKFALAWKYFLLLLRTFAAVRYILYSHSWHTMFTGDFELACF